MGRDGKPIKGLYGDKRGSDVWVLLRQAICCDVEAPFPGSSSRTQHVVLHPLQALLRSNTVACQLTNPTPATLIRTIPVNPPSAALDQTVQGPSVALCCIKGASVEWKGSGAVGQQQWLSQKQIDVCVEKRAGMVDTNTAVLRTN